MLICLGGFFGSGRRILAHRLSARLGFHYYDLDAKKFHRYDITPNKTVRERIQQPNSDKERMRIYDNALKDFPLASKMYHDVILDDAFHRQEPREYFLKEARNYFDQVILVWVESDEASLEGRFIEMKRRGLIRNVESAMRRRKRAERNFQEFAVPPLTFRHTTSDDEATEALARLVSGETGRA